MSDPTLALLCFLLVGCVLALLWIRHLLGYLILLSAYSGILVCIFAILGAADVAMTEAFVGAGISGVILIAFLRRVDADVDVDAGVGSNLRSSIGSSWLPSLGGLALAAFLTISLGALPDFGDPESAATTHVAADYLNRALEDSQTPNVVTAILADYRSLDTLMETAVIVTAALTCALVARKEL